MEVGEEMREGYKKTELGEIPLEWGFLNIGNVAQIQGGYAFKSKDYVDEGTRLVKITNVQQKNLNWEEQGSVNNFV